MNKCEEANKQTKDYFVYYSKLQNQQNMICDAIRTEVYKNAIMCNDSTFNSKTVMDIGSGSGILSMFAAKAGAKEVYAIEASDMAETSQKIIQTNNLENKIKVIKTRVEDLKKEDVPPIDILISEPLGVLLVHERMIESYLYARDHFLVRDGKMFPSSSTIFFLPFSDEGLYQEQISMCYLFSYPDYFGIDFTGVRDEAIEEKLSMPIIGQYNPITHVCSEPAVKGFDFKTISLKDLTHFTVDLEFVIEKSAIVHGIGTWFDAYFDDGQKRFALSTSPFSGLTHWYQVRLLLKKPIFYQKGQILKGVIEFVANDQMSYNITLSISGQINYYNLKNTDFKGFLPGTGLFNGVR